MNVSRVNKYKIAGTLTAILLLAASLILKFGFPEAETAFLALPLLSLGAWALAVFDTLAYKTSEHNVIQKRMELTRLIAIYLISILITIGTVIFIVSGK